MRRHPHLFEANARILLSRLSRKHDRQLTLGTVPEEEWKELVRRGFDLLWLMGVWRRSPGSRRVALSHPGLRGEYSAALPDWSEEDVGGSPYAISAYALDPALGEHAELSELKARLNRLGLGLILDFVPNHTAVDHPWTSDHPERFIRASRQHLLAHPDWFFAAGTSIHLAHGRDPNFPPWTDTAQINFFSEDARRALIDELLKVAAVADGVRCDMAMLALRDVFGRTWGPLVEESPPAEEFWAKAIREVRRACPGFLLLAEAYWGLEATLRDLGFDFSYDMGFYDCLRSLSPTAVREHLRRSASSGTGTVRFIENHDEPRAPAAFGAPASRAAAVTLATVPGLRLFHDGQREGRRVRLPVQLLREPSEAADAATADFYDRLLRTCDATVFHEGQWHPLETHEAWEGNHSHQQLLAWSWQHAADLRVVAVNYSSAPAQGRVRVELPTGAPRQIAMSDELTGEIYLRETSELHRPGLYVALAPWHSHILGMALIGDGR